MQTGIRFHDTVKLPFEERLSVIREQGFTCTHIALSKAGGIPSREEALTPGYAMWMKQQFDTHDIDCAVLGCYLNLAHPDEAELKKIQARYTAHLRFASILGAGVVGTETGSPNKEYRYDPEATVSKETLELFIRNLRPVVEDAERFGVILAIEPVFRHIVSSPARARAVLDAIHSPNLRIIFDPVNLLDPSNIDRRSDVIREAIDLLHEEIAVIHLKDYQIKDGQMSCLACGLGEMDYTDIIRFAKENKPFIHATLENTTPEDAVGARKYIENLENSL